MTTAMPSPVSIARGKTPRGSLHSSTMLTESSKPTIEKNAMAVATVIATSAETSPGLVKSVTREMSPSPRPMTHMPMPMTIASAVSSIRVRTTLNFTLSPTPRRLIAASSIMKPSATISAAVSPVGMPIHSSPPSEPSVASRPASRFDDSRVEDVDALVMPEEMTAKATMKVTKCSPNALCA